MTNIVWIALAATVQANGIQLPNPAIFGKDTTEAVRLLVDKAAGDAEPHVIWSDVRCGRYFAASAFYRPPVTLDAVRAAVSARYGKELELTPGGKSGLWRVDSERFTISVGEYADGATDVVRVTYIYFLSDPNEVKKGSLEANGAKRSDLDKVFGPDPCIDFEGAKPK